MNKREVFKEEEIFLLLSYGDENENAYSTRFVESVEDDNFQE